MTCGNNFSMRAAGVFVATILAATLACGAAFAQTDSGDQLDTGQLLDAMLGVDTTANEPVADTADTFPNPDAPGVSPSGTQNIIETNTLLLTATLDIGDSTITWSTTDGTVAAISPTTGLTTTVTAGNVGTATVTATGDVTGPTNTTINVVAATVGVAPASNVLAIGSTVNLSAASDALSDSTFTWLSSDTAIATVDSTGLVTAVAAGVATITATADMTGRSGVATVTVTAGADPEQGPCFIATAAYGTPLADDIDALREVRDRYMLTNLAGTVFADAYYRLSPPIADAVVQHPALASAMRVALLPVTLLAALALTHPVLTLFAFALGLGGGTPMVHAGVSAASRKTH